MLYLVDEMYKQKDKDIVITFGEPVPIAVFDKRYRDGKWVALLREHIYKLKDNPSATFII
jgi:hypothetical protein